MTQLKTIKSAVLKGIGIIAILPSKAKTSPPQIELVEEDIFKAVKMITKIFKK